MKYCLRKIFIAIAGIVAVGCTHSGGGDEEDLEVYYNQLDRELSLSDQYGRRKESKITLLKYDLSRLHDSKLRMDVIDNLVSEYESYRSDSALYYVDLNLKNALAVGDAPKVQELRLKRADIMSHAGLFGDALDEMERIDRQALDSTQLITYYYVYCGLYQYMGEYTNAYENNDFYNEQRLRYTDSIASVAPSSAFSLVTYNANKLINAGKTDEAIKILLPKLEQYEPGTRSYAILASILAFAYKMDNKPLLYKKYLTLSAISDVKSCTKENMSFRELAQALYDDGDLVRAKHYLQKSFDDANFFSARMRTAQSARMLPVIDTAYDARQHQMQTRLKWLLILSASLSLILIISIFYIWKQMKRIHKDRDTIHAHNEELSKISEQLKKLNGELEETNVALKQSDSIKEETTGLFMVFSSLTISNLEHYQQILHNLAVKGNTKELIKKVYSSNIVDQTLKDFYSKFDDSILNIYPNFVERVNSLMRPEEQIVPKPGSRLNTELRVLALIRIGITDSEKIAEFLRCSLTTVYTYRSKIRRRAANPETFENDILRVGS